MSIKEFFLLCMCVIGPVFGTGYESLTVVCEWEGERLVHSFWFSENKSVLELKQMLIARGQSLQETQLENLKISWGKRELKNDHKITYAIMDSSAFFVEIVKDE